MRKILVANRFLIFLVFLYIVRLALFCSISDHWSLDEIFTCVAVAQDTFVLSEMSNSNNFQSLRRDMSFKVRDYLPPENSALVLGLVLGINELYYLSDFRELLISTGTIHVVVASGFNISLVATLLSSTVGTKYGVRAYTVVVLGTFVYAVVTGFDPPIFRAWLMAVVTFAITNYGRTVDSIKVLLFTALVMLLLDPLYLFDLSFQLSFLATFGILYYSALFEYLFKRTRGSFLRQDFITTVSAQVFVLPLLLKTLGSVSLLGFVVNPLTLWIIPICTILGFVFVFVLVFSSILGSVLAIPLYFLTQVFIVLLKFFDSFGSYAIVAPKNNLYLMIFYLIALVLPNLIMGHSRRSLK